MLTWFDMDLSYISLRQSENLYWWYHVCDGAMETSMMVVYGYICLHCFCVRDL